MKSVDDVIYKCDRQRNATTETTTMMNLLELDGRPPLQPKGLEKAVDHFHFQGTKEHVCSMVTMGRQEISFVVYSGSQQTPWPSFLLLLGRVRGAVQERNDMMNNGVVGTRNRCFAPRLRRRTGKHGKIRKHILLQRAARKLAVNPRRQILLVSTSTATQQKH